jgi:hypothetical protein
VCAKFVETFNTLEPPNQDIPNMHHQLRSSPNVLFKDRNLTRNWPMHMRQDVSYIYHGMRLLIKGDWPTSHKLGYRLSGTLNFISMSIVNPKKKMLKQDPKTKHKLSVFHHVHRLILR